MTGSTYVEGHTPALGAVDPADVEAAQAGHQAAMSAHEQRQAADAAGELKEAESRLQPPEPLPPWRERRKAGQ